MVAGAVISDAPEQCPGIRQGVIFYRGRYLFWRKKMELTAPVSFVKVGSCANARFLLGVARAQAQAARTRFERWWSYHYDWPSWLPSKWQRIGACETGYGTRPGNWRHSNSAYEGAFGFAKSSWDAFKRRADPKAGPYPEDAWQATPRQQYEVALAIWRAYGFSGWGCRGA